MKLVFFLVCCLSISALASVKAQSVDLDVSNESFRSVVKALQKQTGYSFIVHERFLRQAQPITVRIAKVEILEALPFIFKDQPFTYEVNGKTVIAVEQQQKTEVNNLIQESLWGRVTDSVGKPLEGVIVEVSGSNRRTVTDQDGYYVLQNVKSGVPISFRLLGYKEELLVNNRPEINVVLRQVASQLEEVVISKGYYNVTKELNTGSVSSVKAEVLQRQPVSDPLLALSGRVPGLYIQQSSGVPGSAPTFRLRGQNSIANGNDPLFVVDGVPYIASYPVGGFPDGAQGSVSPFANIPIQSIESIEVLKDADATAIYGSRGANGVILITTKKAQQERTSVIADINRGAGRVTRKLNLMNTEQYLFMRRKAFEHDGVNTYPANAHDVNGNWDQDRYTDWQEIMIGGTAQLAHANISIGGGNDRTQFSIAGNYRNETTVFPDDSRNKQLGSYINASHESEDKRFRISYSGLLSNFHLIVPQADFTRQILLAPNAPPLYNDDRTLNYENSTWQNPFYPLNHTSANVSNNLNNDVSLSYNLWEGLTLSSRLGYNNSDRKTTNLTLINNNNPAFVRNPAARINAVGDYIVKSWSIEPMISYDRGLKNGAFSALVGTTFQETRSERYRISASGFSSDEQIKNMSAATTVNLRDVNEIQYRYSAIYARLGYTHLDRYVINLTGRRDGSSRFGPGNQYGNFGAIGLAWLFSNEHFFPINSILSSGKFRASYGVTGNDQLGDYKYISAYSTGGTSYQGVVGLTPIQHTNPNYGWETVNKFEAAFELGLAKDRLQLTVNWYHNRTANQLVGYTLPFYTGFPSVQANLPAVIQNTGIEIDLNTSIVREKNLYWAADFNLSIPRNKLVSYPDLETSSYRTTYAIGHPLTGAFLYQFKGLDSETQIPKFEDRNGDGVIRSADDRVYSFTGQWYFAGLNNSFTIYQNFQLDVFLQYVKQNSYEFFVQNQAGLTNPLPNVSASVLDEGSNYHYFTQSFSSPAYQSYDLFFQSDAALGDASFWRVKNVNLSWTVPDHILNAVKINNLKLYMRGQNLLTLTKYKGLDPEIGRAYRSIPSLPPLKMTTFGIQLTL